MTPATTEKRSRASRAAAEPDVERGVTAQEATAVEVDALLSELRHRRDCPARDHGLDTEGTRIEVIRHTVSGGGLDRGGENDGVTAVVVRCVECGAQYPEE